MDIGNHRIAATVGGSNAWVELNATWQVRRSVAGLACVQRRKTPVSTQIGNTPQDQACCRAGEIDTGP